MIRVLKNFFLILILAAMTHCSGEKRAPKFAIEDFFRNPSKTAFLVSPDGKYISYMKPYNNRLNIFIQTIDGKNTRRLTSESDRITSYFWGNNGMLLYMKDHVKDDGVQLMAISRDGKESHDLLPAGNFRIKLINPNRIRNNEVIIALNQRDSSVFDVYRLNLQSRKLRLAARNPGNITEWYADENGELRMALASDGVNETLLFRESEHDNFKRVITANFKNKIKPVGFCGKDRTCVYALSNLNRDKTALVELDCKTGKETKMIFSHPECDVIEGGYSFKKMSITSVMYETWKKERQYLDDSVKGVFQDIEKQLPNTEIRIFSKDSAERKLIVRTNSDRNPGSFYLYTLPQKLLVKLSDVNSALPESEMCPMKPIEFKSRDGVVLNGYLTLPKGMTAKNLPVVVIPHSHPENRNTWGFNSEVQFLANRGYAVFQVNFRGSNGYGKKFWTAGFKKWGTLIQDDITDGVKWLIATEVANPKKIAIYGSNFGGYSALKGLSSHPELYACGISYSGLTNLFTYMKGVPPYYKPYLQMFYEKVGNPEKDADYFRAVSPIFHTDKIKRPILIIQGTKDPRANVNETNQFVRELKKHGVPVTYVLKQNEGHGFMSHTNKQEVYRQLEKFLADNLNRK